MPNFYSVIPKSNKSHYRNPGYARHGIEIPFRMLVCGASGSYKSNFVLNLIFQMNDTFESITLITKNANEPLYNFLRTKIPEEQLHVYEGIENIPPLDDFNTQHQHLVIFDDLVLEKKQSKVEEYFIRAR